MFGSHKRTILEKLLICGLMVLHINLILPIADVLPLPKAVKNAAAPEARAEEPVNRAPIIEKTAPLARNEGDTIVLEPVVYDPDGDAVTVSYEAPFDSSGRWTIPYNYTGPDAAKSITAKITASDGNLQSFITVDITARNVNAAPAVSVASSNYCVRSNEDFTLFITADDEDGDELTYELRENNAVISAVPIAQITRNLPMPGIYKYTIKATDSHLKSAEDACYVEVIDSSEARDDVFPISGDFNGDGMTDIGAFNRKTGGWKIAISDNGVFNDVGLWMDGFKGGDENYAYSLAGDFNGDGRTDIALYEINTGAWKFALSDGEAFIRDSSRDVSEFGGGQFSPLTGDFNGDGITDIGFSDSSGYFCVKLAKDDKTGFRDTAILGKTALAGSCAYAGDFNGDGLADILSFQRDTGEWRVSLGQDAVSSQLIDWVQDPAAAGETTLTFPEGSTQYGAHKDTYDGNFDSFFASSFAASGGPGHVFREDTIWTFPKPANITKVIAKACNHSESPGGYNKVYLYYDGAWNELGDVVNSESGSGTLFEGSWSGVTKIKLTCNACSHSCNTYTAWCKNYELQAWGPADEAAAGGALPAFTSGAVWKTGFGQGKEPVIADHNHDGKTDIGYFDSASGEWRYALSNGAQFIAPSGNTTGSINDGSHADVCDGDWDTYCGYYASSNGSKQARTITTFEWEPVNISSIKYKCRAYAATAKPGNLRREYWIRLKINDLWTQVDNGSDTGGIKELKTGPSTLLPSTGSGLRGAGWDNCSGIQMETFALADASKNTCEVRTCNYEIEAMSLLPNGTYVNKAANAAWPAPFGRGTDILPSGGDFNGDNVGDAAVFHKDRQGTLNKWEIKLHNSKQPDLLASVDNGIGGTTNIEYEVSTQLDNTGGDGKPDLPFPVQVVKKETKIDGEGGSYEINYEYKDGKFEPDSREFRGFKYVKVIDSEGTVKETRFNQDDDFKGKPEEEIVEDVNGRLYSRIRYEWDKKFLYGGAVTFPYMASASSALYDFKGEAPINEVKTVYGDYDEYGNIGRIDELGFIDDPADDRCTIIEYEYNAAKYIVGKPKRTTIMADESPVRGESPAKSQAKRGIREGNSKVSEAWYRYDDLGSLKEEEKWLNTGESNPVTKFKYDYEVNPDNHSGNLVQVEDALGGKTATAYDAVYEYTFPVQVTNALGHTQSFTYDCKTGQVLASTDPNGQTTRTIYDSLGRAKKVIGPNDTEASPGIEYIYDLSARPVKVTTITKVDAGRTTTAYAFMDGLGRTIEAKTEADDDGKQLLSGVVKYDSRGQVKEKYLPYFVTASPDYLAPDYAQRSPELVEGLKVTYVYDSIGRVIETKRPDGVSSFVQYDGWVVTTIDENGHKMTSEKDAFGRLIKVTEYNGEETDLTQYRYDTLGNLAKTIDSKNNETVITYDSLGRKTAMNDPDMGVWAYEYDKLGNLKKQTDAKGQIVEFDYDAINRLTVKHLRAGADSAEVSSVNYTYDDPAKPDCIGRLSKVTDSSGAAEFFYDNLGREIKTIKTIIPSPQGGEGRGEGAEGLSYAVSRAYDSIDRLKAVTYPDGEIVSYTYNKAGGVETVTGKSGLSQTTQQGTVPDFPERTYISNIDYNENGQMTRVDYGNGAHTEYSYDSRTLRLENLSTLDSRQSTIQNLSYNFDNVGNVKSITDASSSGTGTQSFEYDGLNRLKKAAGKSYGTINYTYDSIGNMLQNGGMTMEYGEGSACPEHTRMAGPHAVTFYIPSPQGGEGQGEGKKYAVTYDPNGNMLSKETSSGVKQFTYDIENRLIEVKSPKEEYISNYEIPLQAGWNFISIPVIVTEDISAILAYSGIARAQVSRYNSETQAWENFAYEQSRDLTRYNSFSAFDYGRGYEIYVDTASTLKVSGIMPSIQKTLDLKAGWNLICAPTTTSIDAAKALAGVEYLSLRSASSLRGITDPEAISYNDVSALAAGSSYFVKVASAQTWNIPRACEEERTSFVYDGDGGRVLKVTRSQRPTKVPTGKGVLSEVEGSTETREIYIGSLYETSSRAASSLRSASGGEAISIKKHIFLGSTRVCTVETTLQNSPSTLFLRPSTIHYYHQDHIGSSSVITDEQGKAAQLIEYSPYGLTTREEGAYNTNYRFTGKLFDTSTQLYYYGARYYDPELGRFIQPDTIIPYPDDPQSFNRYAYARNNPIRYVDPTGHFWWAVIAAVVGAIIGAVSAHNAGGNVWAGAAVGAVAGYFGAGIANIATSAMGIGIGTGVATGVGASAAGSWGGAVITPLEGALITGTEFAIGGFAAGLASGYAGGEGSVGDMFAQAGIGAGIGFGAGFATGYSYTAGWQNVLHGADTQAANYQYKQYYNKALEALKRGDLGAYAKYARPLQQAGISPPSAVLEAYSKINNLPFEHNYLVAIKEGKITAKGFNPRIFGGDVLLNKQVKGVVDVQKDLLLSSRFEFLTSDLAKVSKVLENMDTVKLSYYQMLNFNSNCYGWVDAVLEKSGIPVK